MTDRIDQLLNATGPNDFVNRLDQDRSKQALIQFGDLVQPLVQPFGGVLFRPAFCGVFIAVRFRSGRRGR